MKLSNAVVLDRDHQGHLRENRQRVGDRPERGGDAVDRHQCDDLRRKWQVDLHRGRKTERHPQRELFQRQLYCEAGLHGQLPARCCPSRPYGQSEPGRGARRDGDSDSANGPRVVDPLQRKEGRGPLDTRRRSRPSGGHPGRRRFSDQQRPCQDRRLWASPRYEREFASFGLGY
jgi:hypothetical protein